MIIFSYDLIRSFARRH